MYIPYFYNDEEEHTTINCRHIETGEYKSFISPNRNWILVKPFRYTYETEEETLESLKRVFKTNDVKKQDDYYILADYDGHEYLEGDYKEVIKLPSNYTTKIIFNQRRYFNLFSEKDEWTTDKATSCSDVNSRHLFLVEDSNSNVLYKFADDEKFQILTQVLWEEISEKADIIFTTITRSSFEYEIPENTDYAWISPYWRENIKDFDKWYKENIKDLYLLMYMSSRNMSDILWLNNREDWDLLTDDILLLKNMEMYGKTRMKRYTKNYAFPGKYRNVYVYNLGEILLTHMKNLGDKNTSLAYKISSGLTKFPFVVSSLYNNESVSPVSFSISENSIYLNEKYLFTISPIQGMTPRDIIEYSVILGEGSYMTFSQKTQEFKVHGQSLLCRPLFSAAKKAVRNYMMWDSQGGDANIRIISDMVDKNEETLSVPIMVNHFNYSKYVSILPEDIKRNFSNGKISEYRFRGWLTYRGLVCNFEDPEVEPASSKYIYDLLKQLDKIKQITLD